jgi:hypothetical protein
MVLKLDGPVLRIDKLIEDKLKSEWPNTADPDLTKLQTTVDKIDWGHDYNEHTNFRVTIKVVEVNMTKSTQFKTMHKISYNGTVDVRVQYRDVGEEQPQEIWNIGHEIKNIIVRNGSSLQADKIMDMELDDFRIEEETDAISEYHQELKIKLLQTVISV